MSKIFGGIAISPAGGEEYNVSVSLVSSSTKSGSFIHSESTSSPVNIASLTEAVRSMILSTFTKPTTLTSYITSVPPGFPADRYCDIFNALESAKLIGEYDYPALPLDHGEVYAFSLSKRRRRTTTLLLLDCSSANSLSAVTLSTQMSGGRRVNNITHELSVSLEGNNTALQHALEKIFASSKESNKSFDEIVLVKPTIASEEGKARDVGDLVAKLYPSISLSSITCPELAQAAASFAYAKFLLIKGHYLAKFFITMPVCVVTASGAAVPVVRSSRSIPINLFITLTNSVDKQKSATVRFLMGNHTLPKNNIQRAVVVLDGLKPLPKGEARIRVFLKVLVWPREWLKAAEIVIEQEGGPRKAFLFPRFFAHLPENYEKHIILLKKEHDTGWSDEDSDNVVGGLPE